VEGESWLWTPKPGRTLSLTTGSVVYSACGLRPLSLCFSSVE
jgi:hypothetical protein